MREFVLFQQSISQINSREFETALNSLVTTYTQAALGFLFFILLCLGWLVVMEQRQRRAADKIAADVKQQERRGHGSDSQKIGRDVLFIKQDSLF